MAADRLSSLLNHLRPSGGSGVSAITQKNPDDVVITLALRTPLTKAAKGGFKDTDLDYMIYALLKEVVQKSKLDPALIEDVCLGNVNDGKAAYLVRAAALAAGIPHTAGASSVNRFCSSGLKAVQDIANQIQLGAIDVGIAVGAELMSAGGDRLPRPFNEEVLKNQEAADCMQPMGQTSENVGADFNITREMQDTYAAESFRRAEAAQKAGWFDDEIVPITTKVKDPKTGEVKTVTLTRDEGIRYGTTVEALSKIRPAFPQFGTRTTGGNASQVTDGAAAILLMRRSKAIELNQPILAKFCGATVAGVPPRVMGIGPTAAIPKLLSKFNLSKDDIDIYEINEAFASMAVYCLKNLGLDHAKVNPRGGAIALGHPLGATGARQICTILSEARRTKSKILVTMRQLMAQRLANRPVIAVSVVRIRAQPQLDHLAFIPIQTERAGFARGMLGRIHLRQQRDREAVLCHGGADARVVTQAGQKLQRPRRIGQGVDAPCDAGSGAPGAVFCGSGGAGFKAAAGFGCLGVQGFDFLGWGAEEGEFEFGRGEG
ncbi:hypothetical protein CNMCM8812_003899 [Aspergillus fumigatus]|nr:hypothetical protein CNMCM8812_003899 [Aspergillus fumigatus]